MLLSLREVRTGTEGRNLDEKPEAAAMEELLTYWLSLPLSCNLGAPAQGYTVPLTVGWALSYHL